MALLNYFFKNIGIPPVEKLFNLNLLSTSIAFGIRGVAQLCMGSNTISIAVDFVVAGLLLLFFYLSRYKGLFSVLLWPLILTTQISTVFLWFFLGGINSPVILIFLVSIVCYIAVAPKKQHWMMGLIVLMFSLTTLVLEYLNPEWVTAYTSRTARFVDYGILLTCAISLTTFVLSFMNQRFEEEEKITKAQIKEIKGAQDKAEQKQKILEQLKGIQAAFFATMDPSHSFDNFLNELLTVSQSDCGFVAEVFFDASEPYMKTHEMIESNACSKNKACNPQTLFEKMKKEQALILYSNSEGTDSTSQPFVGIPIVNNGKLIGLLGLGNRAAGYDQELMDLIDPFLSTYATIIQNIKLKRAQQKYEEELRIAKDLAEASSKTKSQFLTNISHELRTPLSLIMGPIAMLLRKKEGTLDEKEIRRMLTMMQKNSNSMLEFMENALDLSKLRMDQMTVSKSRINLYDFVQNIFSEFSIQQTYRTIDYRLEFIVDKDLEVNLDVDKIGKILKNLLSNAFKYTQSGGTVVCKVKVIQDKISFEIEDTGIGISPDDLPHIFERYYQTKANQETIFSGMGVGLAFSQELANLMGFEILVESVLGKGATFSFCIPLKGQTSIKEVSPPKKILDLKASEQNLLAEGYKKNILFIDDSLVMRTFVKRILKDQYNVILAEDGKRGLEILNEYYELMDLVITDLNMPEMDGLELLKHINEKPWASRIPVIVLSANDSDFDRIETLKFGVKDYLSKPFEKEGLLDCINNQLK